MTKTILLGMTAEEIVEKFANAQPAEILEFNTIVAALPNHEEIEKALFDASITKAKAEMVNILAELEEDKKDVSPEEAPMLNAIEVFVNALAGIIDTVDETAKKEEQTPEEKVQFLVTDLISQMNEPHNKSLTDILKEQMNAPKLSLADVFKQQLEPKKPLADILREQMAPEKTLAEILREQVAATAPSITKENIIDKIIEDLTNIELEDDEMVINHSATVYQIAISLLFQGICLEHGVEYELEAKDVEHILSEVVNALVEAGCEVSIRIEDGKVFTVIA